MGRMVSQKIGKADEVKQYRRLLADDTDYRDSLPPETPRRLLRLPRPPRQLADRQGLVRRSGRDD